MLRSALRLLKLSFLTAVLLLSSCKSTISFEKDYYFQSLGKDSNLVATVDLKQLKAIDPALMSTGIGYVDDNATRFSVALYKDEYKDDDYPSSFDDLSYYGAIEGKYSSSLGNTALSFSKEFSKVKDSGLKYYENDDKSFQFAFAQKDMILFANGDYVKAYDESLRSREITITDSDADKMANALAAFYVREPKTMLDLGFDLPLSVLVQMQKALVYLYQDEGCYYLGGELLMRDEKLAKTMLTLLRNIEVQNARKFGQRPNYSLLSSIYVLSDAKIAIERKEISEEEFYSFLKRLNSVSADLI